MLKKIAILLIDCLLHLGFFSPLFMLPGYLPLLIVLIYPATLFLERKFFHFTLAELVFNKKFTIYPVPKTIFKKSIFARPTTPTKLKLFLRILLPLASLITFVLVEPQSSFSSTLSNAETVVIEELHCAIMKPTDGSLSNGVLKLSHNGNDSGDLPYLIYKMENKQENVSFIVQESKMFSEWTNYPNFIVMKGAIYVVLGDANLDKVIKQESGTHQGHRSTTIRGVKNGENQLIRIVLFKDSIYKIAATYPLNDPEKELLAHDFINSFTPKA